MRLVSFRSKTSMVATILIIFAICSLVKWNIYGNELTIIYKENDQEQDDCQIDHNFDPLHPNKLLQCVAKYNDEFNMRFFLDISTNSDSDWITFLSKPNMNSSNTNVCIHMLDDLGGFGNRIFRDPVAFFMAYMHQCTYADHWGYCHNHTNFFADLFEDSYELIACTLPVTKHSISNTAAHYILHNITIRKGYVLKQIHPTIQKQLPFTTILVEVEMEKNKSNNTLKKWDENTIYSDYPLPNNDILFDGDIDDKYAELRPWNAYMKWFPVLRYYGLLIQQLRYKYRMEMVYFLQKWFKNKFIISIHLRTGRNENGFNRYSPSDKDIVYQIKNNMLRIFEYYIRNSTKYRNIHNFGFFVSSDYFGAVSLIRNLLKTLWNNMTNIYTEWDKIGNITNVNWDEIVFTRTKVEWSNQNKFTFGKNGQTADCVIDAKDAYIDSELLGFSDVLILPYVSTFTRLSRALMMKRKKFICHSVTNSRKYRANWFCKDFKSKKQWKYEIDCCNKT